MQSLYLSDSLRAASGDITPLDVLQSQLEATMALQEYRSQVAEYRNRLVVLDLYMGNPAQGTLEVIGQLGCPLRQLSLQGLLDSAVVWRQDLASAHHLAEAAQSEVLSVRRERMPDIDLSLGAEYSTRVRNEEAPAPEFVGYSAGLSIPLPIANLNRGEVRASQVRARQAELEADYLKATIKMQVLQAYNNYEAARQQVADYDEHLMSYAQQVLEGKIYAYRHGQTSLLEVITAQHTLGEIQQAYYNSLHSCMTAWIALQRAAGIPLPELQ
jgi:cobalt-zinc-cadmium efflux system outer membrane protein